MGRTSQSAVVDKSSIINLENLWMMKNKVITNFGINLVKVRQVFKQVFSDEIYCSEIQGNLIRIKLPQVQVIMAVV